MRSFLLSAIAGCLLAGAPAGAAIIGQQVTGSLTFSGDATNYFDPANGYAPPSFLNSSGKTVSISPTLTEFGYEDAFTSISADFTATQLTFTDVIQGGTVPFVASFTSANAGAFGTLSLASSNVVGLSFRQVGNTITLSFPGSSNDATLAATFNVPEPASLTLLGMGLAGIVMLRRRGCSKA